MQKIIILQGPPANGKSTLARKLVADDKNLVIVNRDDIRAARGDYWIPEQEDYISDIEEFEVRSALKHGLTPIIDATNLNSKTLEKWHRIASEFNVSIDVKELIIPFKEALKRDENRERKVGRKVLERFYSQYYPELMKEYYKDTRTYKEKDPMKENVVIVDIDGTLAKNGGRPFYGDGADYDIDTPNQPCVDLINTLSKNFGIIIVSGREGTKEGLEKTDNWLHKYLDCDYDLFMRSPKDYRDDSIIKEEIYHKFIEPYYNVAVVFDDRNKVVTKWRTLGLFCCQVYDGDF